MSLRLISKLRSLVLDKEGDATAVESGRPWGRTPPPRHRRAQRRTRSLA